jgi:hypothetical protein
VERGVVLEQLAHRQALLWRLAAAAAADCGRNSALLLA